MSELPNTVENEAIVERPFPWFCPHCRKKEVRRTSISYQCQRLHNGQTKTLNIPEIAVPRCTNCGQIVFDYVAEEQIKKAMEELVEKTTMPLNGVDETKDVAPASSDATPPVLRTCGVRVVDVQSGDFGLFWSFPARAYAPAHGQWRVVRADLSRIGGARDGHVAGRLHR